MASATRPLAIVTGASAGIGYELAKVCAQDGFDLLVAADRPKIARRRRSSAPSASRPRRSRPTWRHSRASTTLRRRSAAGRSTRCSPTPAMGSATPFSIRTSRTCGTSSTRTSPGTIYLVQKVGRAMRGRGKGRILLTGSIAGFMPGTYQAVYNGTKAFVDSFSFALTRRAEGHRRHGHMPHARRHRNRLLRAGRHAGHQSRPGQEGRSRRRGARRLRRHDAGDGDVVSGWQNKLQTAIANVTPAGILAEQHRKMAEPGTAKN